MIDYQMTIILNAALGLERTPEGIERFKKIVYDVLQPLVAASATSRCICTQLTALEPTVNPDCAVHGALRQGG